MSQELKEIIIFYSFIVLMFFALIVPFVWSYAKNLLDQLYNLNNIDNPYRKNNNRKHINNIKRFYYSMDLIVYSGSIYSIFSFSIALAILWSKSLISWLIFINFILQFTLFIFIIAKGGKDWGCSKYIFSSILISLSFIYSYLLYDDYNNNAWEALIAKMSAVVIIYFFLILLPPWIERPLSALNKLRGIIPSSK